MGLMSASLLAASVALAAAKRWRHVDASRPRPQGLDEARALHGHASRAATHAGARAMSMRDSRGCAAASPTSTIDPTAYGADPTGSKDSTDAMTAAMAALLNNTPAVSPMADGIVNRGGATLDLRGGEYLISAPLVVPANNGNLRIRGGSLRASKDFPSERFLLEVGEEGCSVDVQAVCNEYIVIEDVFFDGAHVAAGCIQVAATMGTTVGPSAFFTGFNEAGVRVLQGHETVVSDAWLAEYYWDETPPAKASSIGIDIHGQDNYLTNVCLRGNRTSFCVIGPTQLCTAQVIVFDYAKVGVSIDGAASILEGVHTWNGGGTGIIINGSYARQDRLLGCYLDYNTLVLVDPTDTTVEDTFFLDTNAVRYP